MNKFSALLASILLLTGVAACGNKQPAPANETPPATAQQPAPSTAPSETAVANEEPAANEPAAAQPAEAVSETDDAPAADSAAATVQPSLRMAGPSNAPPTSSQFKEGTNYSKVVPAQPTSTGPDKVEVLEIFWYGCPHCFALDPAIESWRAKGRPGYVEFLRVPAMWNETTRMHARLFYTVELLGKLEELHTPIFREINVKGDPLNTVEKISAFLREHGVSNDEFQKAFSSFAVENKLQRADFLNRRYRIESVPTVIVNGKYKTDLGMAGGEQQLFSLIGELAAHEHGG